MPNENNNPNQIIVVINTERNQISVSLSIPLYNEVNLVPQHNAIQDHQLSDLENRISALETNLEYHVRQKEDLQDIVNFCYPQD
ncbi:hypothetical protein N0Y54_03260 [Nostoc punctiforme UO1]|uniref:hypothetical protein n=1 Tax=Nostoc punctiforme TaxID=272131 RepID=UPI0030A5C1AB